MTTSERGNSRYHSRQTGGLIRRLLRRVWQVVANQSRERRLRRLVAQNRRAPDLPTVKVVWPLPRRAGGPSDDEIRARFAEPNFWHSDFRFEGGLDFASSHVSTRGHHPLDHQMIKFRHLMPDLLAATGGTLAGRRVLDIACNSGFWAIQCALLGASEVVGFDARPEVIDQANFLKDVVGADNVRFRVMDFHDMTLEALGGPFDVVLSVSFLFFLPEPLDAIRRTMRMAREYVVLDTVLHWGDESVIALWWKDDDPRAAPTLAARPSRKAMEMMFRHLGVRAREVPIRAVDLPEARYLRARGGWLVDVR